MVTLIDFKLRRLQKAPVYKSWEKITSTALKISNIRAELVYEKQLTEINEILPNLLDSIDAVTQECAEITKL